MRTFPGTRRQGQPAVRQPHDAATEPLTFSRPTPSFRAHRLATGELRAVATGQPSPRNTARGNGGWSLAVSAQLAADIETVPGPFYHRESSARRWHDVLLLAAAAVPQVRRSATARGEEGGRGEAEIKVILRTSSAAPEKSREHLKTLRLTLEWELADGRNGGGWRQCFTLGYANEAKEEPR